mgnify:CR=1 FL=1
MAKVKIKATAKAKHLKEGEIYTTSEATAKLLIAKEWAVDPDAEAEKTVKKTRKKR